jgi:hypothetical protein
LTQKGIERASADVGFIFTAYNFRRIINIIGIKTMKEYLKTVLAFVFQKTGMLKSFLSNLNVLAHQIEKSLWIKFISLKRLYLIQNLTVEIGF